MAANGSEHEGQLLEHEYDGIREYDNPLPRWWVLIFWGSFLFSVGYYFHYQLSGVGQSVEQGYALELKELRAEQARRALAETVTEESLRALTNNAEVMTEAKAIFAERCTPCHGAQGQGLIGPNLTDSAWLHGHGNFLDIYKDVSEGFPEKGMPAWQMQLKPAELKKMAALVGSFRGLNLPGKAPEGSSAAGP